MNPSTSTRALIYRLAVAVFALLVVRGIVTTEEADLLTEVVDAVIGLAIAALAARNTPRSGDTT